jgi:hypothetical protein
MMRLIDHQQSHLGQDGVDFLKRFCTNHLQ